MRLIKLNPLRNKYRQNKNWLDDLLVINLGTDLKHINKILNVKPRQLKLF